MVFVSAGHNSQSTKIKQDPGACANGLKEGDLTIDFRNRLCKELDRLGVRYTKDSDEENLAMYLKRIRTGSGSVVVEYHFDSAANDTATGTTALIEEEADRFDRAFGKELADSTAQILGVKNRGVISEAESHRGRLGLMREEGIICLVELCFISNKKDVAAYMANRDKLAAAHAAILQRYEALID